jgi:peptidyl-prolyl cis-trans isomerase A (cyclophilin A)
MGALGCPGGPRRDSGVGLEVSVSRFASTARPLVSPKLLLPPALLPLALLFGGLVGCGPDAALVAEKDKLAKRVTDMEKEKARLEKEADSLHAQVQQLKSELGRVQKGELLREVGVEPGTKLSATLDTNLGQITCALFPDKAPKTVANFVGLAEGSREWTDPKSGQKVKRPLYDGTIFHRVIPTFMIQGGDPMGTGMGGPGYEFEDETDNGLGFTEGGQLAMANAGPNTNGSQFFITDRAAPDYLNGKHTIFGMCGNLDVVKAIADTPKGPNDRPEKDVVIKHISITRSK